MLNSKWLYWRYKDDTPIINVDGKIFGGPLRNGDMLGILNVLGMIRQDIPGAKFHMLEWNVNDGQFRTIFLKWLIDNTDCFTDELGTNELIQIANVKHFNHLNQWEIRDLHGTFMDPIVNPHTVNPNKVVVVPVFDSVYLPQKNWPLPLATSLFDVLTLQYPECEKLVLANEIPDSVKLAGFTLSTDFEANLRHVCEANVYIGGETGLSLLSSALAPGPQRFVWVSTARHLNSPWLPSIRQHYEKLGF